MSRTWNEHHKSHRNEKRPSDFIDDKPRRRKMKPYGNKYEYNYAAEENVVDKKWSRKQGNKEILKQLCEDYDS